MKKSFNLEETFLSALGSSQKLKWLLQWNVNLVEYLDHTWPTYMSLAGTYLAFMPQKKITEIFNGLNKSRILRLIVKERPDLYKIINTPDGIFWLENQIQNFRARFL